MLHHLGLRHKYNTPPIPHCFPCTGMQAHAPYNDSCPAKFWRSPLRMHGPHSQRRNEVRMHGPHINALLSACTDLILNEVGLEETFAQHSQVNGPVVRGEKIYHEGLNTRGRK
jgi:hypothetical protein